MAIDAILISDRGLSGFVSISGVLSGGWGKSVKASCSGVKKASTEAVGAASGSNFVMFAGCERCFVVNGETRDMGVVIFIVLTLAIFALLGLVQKLVERL